MWLLANIANGNGHGHILDWPHAHCAHNIPLFLAFFILICTWPNPSSSFGSHNNRPRCHSGVYIRTTSSARASANVNVFETCRFYLRNCIFTHRIVEKRYRTWTYFMISFHFWACLVFALAKVENVIFLCWTCSLFLSIHILNRNAHPNFFGLLGLVFIQSFLLRFMLLELAVEFEQPSNLFA